MKILITGGAGYIGSHATKYFIEQGHDIIVIDNLATGHKEAVDAKAKFYQLDIADYDNVCDVIKKEQIEGVVHFAAFSLVGESMKNPHKYYENNMAKTNHLLKAIVDCQVKYLVFSSTAATYGEPTNVPISETDPTVPTNVYGETKLSMEKMIHWYHEAYGLNYVALRYFNVAGAYPDLQSDPIGEAHNPETHLIPIVLQVASGKRDHLDIYGADYETADGTCIRDYIHVIDLADAHLLALTYLEKGNESTVFNLGSGEGFSVKEIVDAARIVTKRTIPTIIAKRRTGDPARLIASSQKAKAILNWQPKFENVQKMIEDAWNWECHKRY